MQTDVAVEAQVEALVQSVIEQFGRLDVLVNNAGERGPVVCGVSGAGDDHGDRAAHGGPLLFGQYLTVVGHHEHVALVALDPGSHQILGSARYIRLPARAGDAEIATEVIDEWQRRGVGRALLDALSRHAQDAGIERFIAIVSRREPADAAHPGACRRLGRERRRRARVHRWRRSTDVPGTAEAATLDRVSSREKLLGVVAESAPGV